MTEFIWTDELVKEFAAAFAANPIWDLGQGKTVAMDFISAFKTSKQSPEWEIMEVKDTRKQNGIFRRRGSSWINESGWCSFSHLDLARELESGDCSIHAVRRLSDGEVFRVGNWVHNEGYTEYIDRWQISQGGDMVALFKDRRPISIASLVKDIINGRKSPEETLHEEAAKPGISLVEQELKHIRERANAHIAIIQAEKKAKNAAKDSIPHAANGKVPVWLTPADVKKLEQLLEHMLEIRFMKADDHRKLDLLFGMVVSDRLKMERAESKLSYTIPEYKPNPIMDSLGKLLSEYEIAQKEAEDASGRMKLALDTMREIFTAPQREQPRDSAGPLAADQGTREQVERRY